MGTARALSPLMKETYVIFFSVIVPCDFTFTVVFHVGSLTSPAGGASFWLAGEVASGGEREGGVGRRREG